jgi:hypothetical protein
LAAASPDERPELLLELVRVEAAGVLGLASAGSIGPGRAFKEVGFDSLAAVELRNRLGTVTGMRLPATLVFDYPSSREIAGYLLGELDRDDSSTGPSIDRTLDEVEHAMSAIAPDRPERQRVAARLRACLSVLDGDGSEEDLSTASDDEMFEILDTELGAL